MKKLVEFGLQYKAVMLLLTAIIVIGGIFSFFSLGRLEDPPFSVKSALVITQYPGATPEEVEQEVTDRLETAIHQMPQVEHIYSMSREGLSYIKVDVKDRYWAKDLPQVWDELRRKINDVTSSLPPGVEPPRVVDDFGFVFGFLLAITGEGFSHAELEDKAENIQKQLYLVPNIARIDLWGVQQRTINLDVSNQKISELRLSPQTIHNLLAKQNMIVNAGSLDHENIRYPMHISGEFKNPHEVVELIIQPQTNDLIQDALEKQKTKKNSGNSFSQEIEKNEKNKFSLGDIASVSVGYQDPPVKIMKFNGIPAIGIQIAGTEDSNIVEVGRQIDEKLRQLQEELPIGIELHKISWQSIIVQESISGFVLSMIESIIIVLIVLLIPSGMRMGGIIGLALILTILATFLYMYFMKIPLERMSLGALIIAMGMMVDNSIVVADGIAVNLRKGMDKYQAALKAAATPALPLLSATFIAVMSFYPIYASEGSTGEYCRTLFVVVAVSLIISWFISLLMTPQQCLWFLDSKKQSAETDEFNTPFFNRFRKLVRGVIRQRLLSVSLLLVGLVMSFIGFQYVVKLFFPNSTRPQLMVDYWAPAGTSIHEVTSKTNLIEKKFQEDENVESVSSFIGAGPPRFYLPVDPEFIYSNYGQLLINFKSFQDINPFIAAHSEWLQNEFPEALVRIRKYNVGPGDAWKFELRLLGPYDVKPNELRQIGSSLLAKIQKTPLGNDWRLDIMNPIRQLNFDYDQKRARSANISREDIANGLKRGYDGLNIGLYREKNKLYKIQWRNTDEEKNSLLSHLDTLPIRGENKVTSVPLSQISNQTEFQWEEPYILRWDRQRQVAIQGSPILTSTFVDLKESVSKDIKDFPLPKGFSLFWDGEEDSSKTAQKQLLPGVVPTIIVILLCLVLIFNDFRPIAVILCTIPFAMIGITGGLLLFDVPFGFMALLGSMSLAGMMNKNIVVLLDACNENLANGMHPYDAIIEAAVCRARPVMLAAGTTVLGVIPLLQDVFWIGLAVAIMGGLAVGSVLTLFAVPLFYSIIYRIQPPVKENT
ncbi:MAG: efflux RND transporter permease subunit [Parachlamydiaceae bacterium]|nr:efflux RND transporter permease subunit [Parachlamydiaceae bacterium]